MYGDEEEQMLAEPYHCLKVQYKTVYTRYFRNETSEKLWKVHNESALIFSSLYLSMNQWSLTITEYRNLFYYYTNIKVFIIYRIFLIIFK